MANDLIELSESKVALGTAEWASETPLRSAKPGEFLIGLNPQGDVLGHRDDGHVAMVCRTRGGKGTSFIVPNLIEWPGSIVVIDPKGENAMVTARRRANGSAFSHGMGHKVRILDPFDIVRNQFDEFKDLKTGFNPLSLLRADRPDSVDIAYRIAGSLVDTETGPDPYFPMAARDMMKAIILHIATSPDFSAAERNLVTVRRYMQAGDVKASRLAALNAKPGKKPPSGFSLLALSMIRNHALGEVIADAGRQLTELEKSPRTLTSIMQTACTALDFLDGPGMRECVSTHGFDLSELKTAPRGTSIYLCLPQRYMDTHYGWLRMMVTLAIGEMETIPTPPKSGHQVLMVLDEFPALRRMRVIENAAAQIAGFGIKLVMVMQTLAQAKDIYKDNWETLLANATTKLFFGNDDQFTRQYVSNLIGECEVTRTTKSVGATEGQSLNESTFSSSGTSISETMGSSFGVSSAMGGNTNVSSGSSYGSSAGISTSTGSAQASGASWSASKGRSEVLHKRLLITPDEIGRQFGNPSRPRVLALISGHQPIGLDRLSYFSFKRFRGKYDPHIAHKAPPKLAELAAIEAQEAAREAAQAQAEIRYRKERERERARAISKRLQRQEEMEQARVLAKANRAFEENRRHREEERRETRYFWFVDIPRLIGLIGFLTFILIQTINWVRSV